MKFCTLILLLISAYCGFSQQVTQLLEGKAIELGFNPDRLNSIDTLMQSYIDKNKLPGIIAVVARHGKLAHFGNFGTMAPEKPMQPDAIFRIASMTKPITSVAVMQLFEEGHFQLDDPVGKYISELAHLKVWSAIEGESNELCDQFKPITIRQLLMHTSGLASGGENTPVDSMYRIAGLSDGSLKDMVHKIAGIPLLYQPGTHWNYSRSTDVLAYLVEVISGKPFNEYIEERIFTPLAMKDTEYWVTEEKANRVASVYCPSDSFGIEMLTIPEVNDVSTPVKFFSGNGGLYSTASDYLAFCQMLLNKGEFNGVRILSPKSVELMTSNQLQSELMPTDDFWSILMQDMGFGYGFAVLKGNKKSEFAGSQDSYWWSGSANTYFFIDPEKDLILLFMTQFVPNYYYPVCTEFRECVYKSMTE